MPCFVAANPGGLVARGGLGSSARFGLVVFGDATRPHTFLSKDEIEGDAGMRTWKVSKTRSGKPKVTLYESGRILLSQPVTSVALGNRLGRAWSESVA